MPYQFTQLYGDDKGESCFKNVLTGLKNLFDDYVHGSSVTPVSVDSATAVTELVSGSGVGSSEVGLSLPTIAVLETWTVANWKNGKWLGNYYLLLPFCNLPVWTVGTWNYEARTNG
nr:zinc finger BED domain-containing protein RICESLEEPER 2-like [Ipomoea batatas]